LSELRNDDRRDDCSGCALALLRRHVLTKIGDELNSFTDGSCYLFDRCARVDP
jgi:hypothetical protein